MGLETTAGLQVCRLPRQLPLLFRLSRSRRDPKTNIAATDVGFPDGFQPDPNTGTALVNGTAWIRSNFFPNLFEHEHDESEQCPGIPYREEYGGVEISTGRCHEITLAQPCLLDINVGDRIRIIAWHSQLVSEDPEPHEGVFMLAMNDTLLWSETSPIPGCKKF